MSMPLTYPSSPDLIDFTYLIPSLSNPGSNGVTNYANRLPNPSTPPPQHLRYPSLTVRPRKRTSTLRTNVSSISAYRPASFWPAPPDHVTLLDAIKYPAVLSHLLDHLAWRDFLAFGHTCRESMRLLRHPELKDVILSRFIPSYRHAVRDRNFLRYKDVPVTYSDITLFRESPSTANEPRENRSPSLISVLPAASAPAVRQARPLPPITFLSHRRVAQTSPSIGRLCTRPLPLHPPPPVRRPQRRILYRSRTE